MIPRHVICFHCSALVQQAKRWHQCGKLLAVAAEPNIPHQDPQVQPMSTSPPHPADPRRPKLGGYLLRSGPRLIGNEGPGNIDQSRMVVEWPEDDSQFGGSDFGPGDRHPDFSAGVLVLYRSLGGWGSPNDGTRRRSHCHRNQHLPTPIPTNTLRSTMTPVAAACSRCGQSHTCFTNALPTITPTTVSAALAWHQRVNSMGRGANILLSWPPT